MRVKDELEMDLASIIKTARTSIRLKHSLAADAELNKKLPEIEKAFNRAIARGTSFSLESFKL